MPKLEERIESNTVRASRDGTLVPIATDIRFVEDGGIDFLIHITALQEKKARAKNQQASRPLNPFLPPDPDLLIGPVGSRHTMVLNKFNVFTHHLLIVTRDFEAQENLLNNDDFAALGACMSEVDGLGFYNGGTVAGASQSHKHLQLVPLPLTPGDRPTPIDVVVPSTLATGEPAVIGAFDFTHSLIPLDGSPITADRAPELLYHFTRARGIVGVHDENQPYNLLLTRRWMLVVPRSREFWRGVSINALGFAGSLLVRNQTELAAVEKLGPLTILKTVVEDPSHSLPRVRPTEENR